MDDIPRIKFTVEPPMTLGERLLRWSVKKYMDNPESRLYVPERLESISVILNQRAQKENFDLQFAPYSGYWISGEWNFAAFEQYFNCKVNYTQTHVELDPQDPTLCDQTEIFQFTRHPELPAELRKHVALVALDGNYQSQYEWLQDSIAKGCVTKVLKTFK